MILTLKTRRALLVLTAGAILVLSLIPKAPDLMGSIPYADKIEHFASYTLLAFLLTLNIAVKIKSKFHTVIYAIVICILYGAVIEFLQQYTGRSPEFLDLAADFAGSGTGAILAALVEKK